jgi:hypothetical protein
MGFPKYEGWPRTSSGLIGFSVYDSDPMAGGPRNCETTFGSWVRWRNSANSGTFWGFQIRVWGRGECLWPFLAPFEAPSFNRDHVIATRFYITLYHISTFLPSFHWFYNVYFLHYAFFSAWHELSRLLRMRCITWYDRTNRFLPL